MENKYLPPQHRCRSNIAIAVYNAFEAMFGNEAIPLRIEPWLLAGDLVFFLAVETEKFVIHSSNAMRRAVTAVEAGT
jgi:hypothetical protein